MRTFIERALKKLPKMTAEQITALLLSVAAENERLESVLDSLTEGLLVCDDRHDLVLLNKGAERILPLAAHEQTERPLWSVISDERVSEFLKATLTKDERVLDREFNVDSKGVHRLLSISVLPLVKDRKVTGSLVHVEDITEKRGKEARLRRAENLASLTTLAAGVAHEIKNPLGSISIHIQLIQKAMKTTKAICLDNDTPLDPSSPPPVPFDTIEKYLGVVNEEIDRLNRIVVDFLFAVRPMDMDLREGDLNGLIRELVNFVHYELEEADIATRMELSDSLPEFLFDERYIKQALLNLIKNAVAAMPEGGTLTVRTERGQDDVRIVIADTGIGIPEENLAKVFEPYFTTKETGSGLGLTLVFKIVKEHRGEISVRSVEGEGTWFIISLPVPQKETRLISYGGSKA